MNTLTTTSTLARDLKGSSPATTESWFDDACVLDIDNFVKTLSGIKAKGVHSELLGSLISHYASKWLPELSGREMTTLSISSGSSPDNSVAAWMKKRFLIETLIGILPSEKDSVQCGFLMRLLRVASMVEVSPASMAELEARVAAQLERVTLKEVMIPAFRHTCGTVLDVGLVLRLVKRFVGLEEVQGKSGAAAKVVKLVDSYLAEVALEPEMKVEEFEELAKAVPSHARTLDDGLYRAIDTYMKTHPGISKQERKTLSKLMDTKKLSSEASNHAAQNERLPIRSVIQILLSDHSKIARLTSDYSGPMSLTRSPNSTRCHSKRELLAQHQEVRRLKDDVTRLQLQCQSLQAQIDRITEKNRKGSKRGFFGWSTFLSKNSDEMVNRFHDGRRTPMNTIKATPKWRHSSS
ncbi:root phototropism protein 3-like [Dioscorea cayenensis subsp. rotundata]|uniref:Root phototropism protein 3-like n=1 Tax=Dioscorea cayennensis subsp. rotundata TaxID=55577 RepID=A0AB40B9U1_DIOCR|nr:root phototropism protein 3-like [Dioscorea cayenensis subsp. rotundata]